MSNKCIQIEYAIVWSVSTYNTAKTLIFQGYDHEHLTPWGRHWLLKEEYDHEHFTPWGRHQLLKEERMYYLLLKKTVKMTGPEETEDDEQLQLKLPAAPTTRKLHSLTEVVVESRKNFLKKHAGFGQKQSCKCSSSYECDKNHLKWRTSLFNPWTGLS